MQSAAKHERQLTAKMLIRLALCPLLFALCFSAWAQPRIGFLVPGSSVNYALRIEAFQQGLRDLGYVEGENIVIEGRWAEGSAERLAHLIAELIGLKVDVMVVGSAAGALAAKNAGITTPVVFTAVTDPLGYGLIGSLARPGGNLTGTAMGFGEGFSGKWVELLKETVPKVARVAVLRNPNHPLAEVFLRETQAAGRALGIRLDFFEARDPSELDSELSRMEKERSGALIVIPDPLFSSQRSRIVDFGHDVVCRRCSLPTRMWTLAASCPTGRAFLIRIVAPLFT